MKIKRAILGVVGLGTLAAPVCADTIPLSPVGRPTIIGTAWVPMPTLADHLPGLSDMSGSFTTLPPQNDVSVPDAPVDPEITIGLGGGTGISGGGAIGDAPSSGLTGVHIPDDKSDPTGVTVPLPGAGVMGLAGLVGVMAAGCRRRR